MTKRGPLDHSLHSRRQAKVDEKTLDAEADKGAEEIDRLLERHALNTQSVTRLAPMIVMRAKNVLGRYQEGYEDCESPHVPDEHWGPVMSEDVPEAIKEPETMGQMRDGMAAFHKGHWYRVMLLDDGGDLGSTQGTA